jgi:hypothetical protein
MNIVIKPEAQRQSYWTKVSIDTFVSADIIVQLIFPHAFGVIRSGSRNSCTLASPMVRIRVYAELGIPIGTSTIETPANTSGLRVPVL